MDIETDILVIGAGVAGVAAALAAARQGTQVLLIADGNRLEDSNTAYAQGGIIAGGREDSPELLARDIMEAGAGLCEPTAVRHLAENGPPLLHRLLVHELNVNFDRNGDGGLHLTEEAAHSLPRIAHAEDLTGRAVIRSLTEAAQHQENLTLRRGMMAVDLLNLAYHSKNLIDLYKPPTCIGAYALDTESGEVQTIAARRGEASEPRREAEGHGGAALGTVRRRQPGACERRGLLAGGERRLQPRGLWPACKHGLGVGQQGGAAGLPVVRARVGSGGVVVGHRVIPLRRLRGKP